MKIVQQHLDGGRSVLPPAFLNDVDGPVDGAWRPADIPAPHFEAAALDRGGQEHTVGGQTHVPERLSSGVR